MMEYLIGHGIKYLFDFFTSSGGFVFLPFLLIVMKSKWKEERLRTLFLVLVFYCLYLIGVGGDFYFYSRFYFPLVPFFAILSQEGLLELKRILTRAGEGSSEVLGGPFRAFHFLLPACLLFFSFHGYYREGYLISKRVDSCRVEIGKWLRDHVQPGKTAAMNAVGIVPYYSRLRTIDMLGLTDDHISHRPQEFINPYIFAHNKQDANYVYSVRPDLIIPGEAMLFDVPDSLSVFKNEGIIPYDSFQEYVRHRGRAFPGDWHLISIPGFQERYVPRSVKIGSLYFYYLAYDDEAEQWRAEITENPENAEALAKLGEIYGVKGVYEEADKLLEKAKNLNARYVPLYNSFQQYCEQHLPGWGLRHAPEAVRESLARAERFMREGKMEQAKQELEALLKERPDTPTAHYNLGVIAESEQHLEKAIEEYQRAIEYDSRYADAYNNLGTVYAKTGRLDLAAAAWRKAVAQDPESPAGTNLMLLEKQQP
jgi:tetratricopeptide (TPR) repeat protein